MKICVFCSSNAGLDPDFSVMAEELGRWTAENGHDLVFGGHDAGLMHSVSKAAHEAGGRVIGVVPRVIEEMGKLSPWLDVHIPTENLSDRKDLMVLQSDVFIVLPGGIGTLDELFTVLSAATLGYHQKPLIVYNMKGFWNSLLSLLEDLEHRGVLRGSWHQQLHVASSLDEVAALVG